jgi:DHA1 family multidrug resistance protein-like MFS transporter
VSRPRHLRLLLYVLTLASASLQFAVVPILPVYRQHFGLTGIDEGILLACPGLATLAISLPVGVLSDRLGARPMTLWAAVLAFSAALMEALAPSFGWLLASRLAFGTSYGMLWTAGLAWLAQEAPGRSSLGGSVASAGAGGVLGPALSGVLVQYLGLRLPFLAWAGAFAAIALGLALHPRPASSPPLPSRLSHSLLLAFSEPATIVATAGIVVAALSSGISSLLVPGELYATGSSSGTIGLAFGAAGGLFVLGSVLTAAFGLRSIRLPVAFGAMVALVVAMVPAALSTAAVAVVGMLFATTAARSVIWAVSYPLGARGAAGSGAGLGMVMGVLNGVWAAFAVLSPLLGGAAASHASPPVIFALTASSCLLVPGVAALLVVGRHRPLAVTMRRIGP